MRPQAWVRYWIVGLVLGPALAIYGFSAGNGQLGGLGLVITFVAIGMIGFWRQKNRDGDIEPRS